MGQYGQGETPHQGDVWIEQVDLEDGDEEIEAAYGGQTVTVQRVVAGEQVDGFDARQSDVDLVDVRSQGVDESLARAAVAEQSDGVRYAFGESVDGEGAAEGDVWAGEVDLEDWAC